VTAVTAVQAANSGQLVLATAHAESAAAAPQSLRAWGAHPHFVGSALLGVISQRLVRTLCRECRVPRPFDETSYLHDELLPWMPADAGRALWTARGCPACHGTGYAGRTGVFEVLRVSAALRRLVAQGRPTQELRDQAVRDGLIELRQSALLKVAQGLTTAEEVARAVPAEFLYADPARSRGGPVALQSPARVNGEIAGLPCWLGSEQAAGRKEMPCGDPF
jgi:type II secretory ATPase GspE/PulE/Tfp pilus assembly ATPase PilB-like protein